MDSWILKGASFLGAAQRAGKAVRPLTSIGNTTLTRLIKPAGQAAAKGFTLLGQPFINAPREFMRAKKFRGISKDINKTRKAVSTKGPWANELRPTLHKLTKQDMIWPEEALDVPRRNRQNIESFLNRESMVAEMTEQDAIDNLVRQLQRAGIITTSAGVPALAGALFNATKQDK